MLRHPESSAQSGQNGYGFPDSIDTGPFVPSKEQGGLFAAEFLPPSHQVQEVTPETISLPLEIVDAEKERKVQQGEFVGLNLSDLNTVVQQRKIYEDIDVLAANIEEEGLLIHPLFVVRYTSEEAAHSYLVAAYGTVGKKVPQEERKRLVDLATSTKDGKQCWYIVIAGHRRLRALEMLKEKDSVVQVFEDMDPFRALKVQVSENTSKLPKDFERAEQNGDLFSVDNAMEPNLTVEQFAKRVGHRPEVIRRDLLYYGLPDAIKNFVVPRGQVDTGKGNTRVASQPLMPFRVASQLGRLMEKGVPQHDVLFLARRFWDEGLTSEESVRKRVNGYLKAYSKGDIDMENIFGYKAEETARLRRNHEVGQRFVKPVDAAIEFFRRVAIAKENSLPVNEDRESYALASRKFRTLGKVMGSLLPDMKSYLSAKERAELRRNLAEMERTTRQFGSLLQLVDTDLQEEDREVMERNERALLDGKEVII